MPEKRPFFYSQFFAGLFFVHSREKCGLEIPMRAQALQILLDKDNLLSLAPVLPTVMRAVRGLYADLGNASQARIDEN